MIGEREVVFKTANVDSLRRGRRLLIENKGHFIPPSARLIPHGTAGGVVESKPTAVDALNLLRLSALPPTISRSPIHGVVAVLSHEWTRIEAGSFK
jgi:hypothetical protein